MAEPTPLSLEVGAYITSNVLAWINTWPGKPCDVTLEVTDKHPPAIMLQQLSGALIKRQYINGDYIASFPFTVYVRTGGEDTASRIDATATLSAISEWMKANYPDLGTGKIVSNVAMTALPAIAARYDNGHEDYSSLFEIEYTQKGN